MIITLDFETEAIAGNPLFNPPRPVGLAVHIDGAEPQYLSTWTAMLECWSGALWGTDQLLFHNSNFDISVATKWFGTPWPHWSRVHDTLFLAYINDPYSTTLHLKDLANRYVGLAPSERDELYEWIMANIPEASAKGASPGAFISRAPVDLVARYAKGDVVRTRLLYDHLAPLVPRVPYDRERRLAPKLAESSRTGIRVDRTRLEEDYYVGQTGLLDAERRIFTSLGTEPFDLGKGAQLADALERAGKVSHWVLTPTGKRSTAKDNLLKGVQDKPLLDLLAYRSTLRTCLSTFIGPWLQLSAADNRLHTEWNQVANDEGATGHAGTRTGRLSSSRPNFQNPPNTFELAIPSGLPGLPNLRGYLLPELYHRWIKRDFSSQEIRILAHFEDGVIMEMYRANPAFDPHQMATDKIEQIMGRLYPRKKVKIVAFSIIYGSGIPGLASQLGSSHGEAQEMQRAYYAAMPSVPALAKATKARGRAGGAITTWGGRQYYMEVKLVGDSMRRFDYKLLNYLIQGSAADQTKQVICDWWEDPDRTAVFMATIHDEINASAPAEEWGHEMKRLRIHMDADLLDVPMRSEGFYGESWGTLNAIDPVVEYA